jgi:hypothetical protein
MAASPTYASTLGATVAWKYGPGTAATGGTTRNDSAANTVQNWLLAMHRLNLNAGTYTITGASAVVGNTQTLDCTQASLAIYSLAGGNFTKVYDIDISAGLLNQTALYKLSVTGLSTSITLAASTDYYIGVGLNAKANRTASRPSIVQQGAASAGPPTTGYVYNSNPGGIMAGAALPTTIALASADLSDSRVMLIQFTFTSAVREVFTMSSAALPANTTPKYLIPFRETVGDVASILLRTVTCADATTLSVVGNFEFNNSATNELFTAVMNFGVTDKMTFAATDVNLNGTLSEGGNNFDFLIQTRALAASTRGNLFWVDLATGSSNAGQGPQLAVSASDSDYATFSHATKSSGSRFTGRSGYQLHATAPHGCEWIELSSTDAATGTIAELHVSDYVMALYGASNYGNTHMDPAAALGNAGNGFIAAFAMPYWKGGMPSNAWGFSTNARTAVGYRFASITAGLGDLGDAWQLFPIFGDIGGNDLKDNSPDSAPDAVANGVLHQATGGILTLANARSHIAAVCASLSFALQQGSAWDTVVAERQNVFLLLGLHKNYSPTNIAGVTDPAWAAMTEAINGIADAFGCWFYNPYAITVANPTYIITADGEGVHFSPAGGAALAAGALSAIQADQTGAASGTGSGGSLAFPGSFIT